ncbi:uncharacterized protein LOC120672206 isoform X2 [Panicum virgatum]|uniref:uncharacterized protein LOC120672206 isoform X2 n=1 Tax=Panicum virgatum TaxID=38727 RepID=UPI0019D5B025|nr:uncharacterized protein LOC120672206 isoform X2 [Panicum virgatum]
MKFLFLNFDYDGCCNVGGLVALTLVRACCTTPTPSPVVTDSPASQFFCSRYYSGAFSCVTDSPASQGQASSPPEPAFALGPVTVPTAPSPEKSVVSPAAPTEPQNAPKSGNFLHHMVTIQFCLLIKSEGSSKRQLPTH